MALVSPSLLAADFLHLDRDIDMINQSEADWFHLDIMDGSFVPNISFGFPVIEAVAKACQKPLDVHYMINAPERYIARTAKLGAMMMNVHYEASVHLHRTIQEIHDAFAVMPPAHIVIFPRFIKMHGIAHLPVKTVLQYSLVALSRSRPCHVRTCPDGKHVI